MVRLKSAFFRTYSTARELCLWTFSWRSSLVEFQQHWMASLLESLSKIPSEERTMKSCSFWMRKHFSSGVAITTMGLPPNSGIFASMSPKVRETESRPGKTRMGPRSTSLASSPVAEAALRLKCEALLTDRSARLLPRFWNTHFHRWACGRVSRGKRVYRPRLTSRPVSHQR